MGSGVISGSTGLAWAELASSWAITVVTVWVGDT